MALILDGSLEGHAPPPRQRADLEAIAERAGLARLILLTQNRAALDTAASTGPVHTLYLHAFLHIVLAYLRRLLERKTRAAYVADRLAVRAAPERTFTALMHRPKPHRVVLFGWLIRHGALPHGFVSFHGVGAENARALDDVLMDAHRQFPRFADEIDAFAASPWAREPFRNFEEQEENFILSWTGRAHRSPISLVAESEMSNGAQRRFTEKALKGPLALQDTIVAGNPGTLAELEALGLGPSGFDDGYDRELDPEGRLAEVLARLEARLTAGPDTHPTLDEETAHARLQGFQRAAEADVAGSLSAIVEACAAVLPTDAAKASRSANRASAPHT